MKKRTKILWILLAAGTIGIAATMGFMLGSNALMSREAVKTYEVTAPFTAVQLKTAIAEVNVLPLESGEARVEAYAKAWLPNEIDMDSVVGVDIAGGVLTVTETPFPDQFLGVFPQPYELKLRVYLPQNVYEQWEGDAK